jgi:hypothetical protein
VIDRTQLTEALAWWVDVVADVQTDTFTLTMSRTMARRTLSALERLLDFPTDQQVEAAALWVSRIHSHNHAASVACIVCIETARAALEAATMIGDNQ